VPFIPSGAVRVCSAQAGCAIPLRSGRLGKVDKNGNCKFRVSSSRSLRVSEGQKTPEKSWTEEVTRVGNCVSEKNTVVSVSTEVGITDVQAAFISLFSACMYGLILY
jgi:hypothetical protein